MPKIRWSNFFLFVLIFSAFPIRTVLATELFPYTIIVVLGTEPLDDTTPSLDMVRRVETGIKVFKANAHSLLFFSGGKTAGPISEARMMARMAYARGISPDTVLMEERSRSTVENAKYCAVLVRKYPAAKFILVTRQTHMPRAYAIFKSFPEFRTVVPRVSYISREEVEKDFEGYLRLKDRPRTRQVLKKILAEFDQMASGRQKHLDKP